MNSVVNADFESILLPYNTCEKQNETNKSIKKHAKEFRSELQCIPVNTNKYMPFSIPIKKKEYANTKNTKKEYVTYNLKFIDSARHINASLSNLVDNLSEINKCNCDNE